MKASCIRLSKLETKRGVRDIKTDIISYDGIVEYPKEHKGKNKALFEEDENYNVVNYICIKPHEIEMYRIKYLEGKVS